MKLLIRTSSVLIISALIKLGTGFTQCGDKMCKLGDYCVTTRDHCAGSEPCVPRPVCVPPPCEGVRCKDQYHVCVPSTYECDTLADCPQPKCVLRTEQKPGFCPTEQQVTGSVGGYCRFDTSCRYQKICCDYGDAKKCVDPLPDDQHPCLKTQCPSHTPTCALRDGKAVCLGGQKCQPGTNLCYKGRHCYCNDRAETICISPRGHCS